jgi:hypothetical protein
MSSFPKMAKMTAMRSLSQYRRGVGSPLAKRYERLVDEAERAGFTGLLPLSEAGL